MAITPSDFSKIWASNADTPEYTFSEANYLKGWDFVGNLPPTRAQWNAIQKSTDEKMKYVFDNFGAPLTASTVADMTMQNRVYVYTGSETGYTAGHWYYWNGSWTDGGVYNAVAIVTDTTLTQAGVPADAKATGDAIALKPDVDTTLTISGAAADAKVVGDELSPIRYVSLLERDLQQGQWADGAIITSATSRLCNKILYPVTPGDQLVYTTTTSLEFYIVIFDEGGHIIYSTDWINSTEAETIPIQHYGRMGIVFRGVGFSYITPARYTSSGAVFDLYTSIGRNVQNIINKMPLLNDLGQFVTIGDDLFEIGSIYNGNNIASTNRIRTIDGFWLPIGSVIKSSVYKIGINEYNANGQYVASQGWVKGEIVTTQPYVRLLVAKTNDADITSEEIATLVSDVKIITDLFTLSANVHELSLGSDDFENLAPAYWKTYMQTHLPNIVAQVRESAMTGDSFIFFTDYHIEYNSGNSHLLMENILKNSPIHKVVFGGDAFNGSATKEDAFAKLQEFVERFHNLPVYGIRGNHEYNLNDGGSEDVKLTENEIYNYIIAPCDDKITSSGKMYYYVDYQPRKIRYIFLDSRNLVGYDDYPIDDAQMAWLTSVLSELTADWSVVIFVHSFMAKSGDTWYVSTNGEKIETAIAASSTPATICAIISGHFHEDYSMMKNGIAYIVTTCDQTPRNDPDRTSGTTSELAFDVFTIDTEAKTIKAYRVGYGDNRSWTYGQ